MYMKTCMFLCFYVKFKYESMKQARFHAFEHESIKQVFSPFHTSITS